jgi:hypothetical protein
MLAKRLNVYKNDVEGKNAEVLMRDKKVFLAFGHGIIMCD